MIVSEKIWAQQSQVFYQHGANPNLSNTQTNPFPRGTYKVFKAGNIEL